MIHLKAVFIDRDGTLGGGDEVTFPKDFELFSFSRLAMQQLKKSGYRLIAFTNQPDISRGLVKYEEFEQELLSFGFDDVCICPHRPEEHCKCRKPGIYLIEKMAEQYHLEVSKCYVIGDRWSDMLAGIRAGLQPILVKTGAGKDALEIDAGKWDTQKAVYLAENLLDAADWIVSNH